MEIKFKYVFSDDYNPDYVNGAYGGIGPRNEIIANFFLERQALPNSETSEVNEKGIVKKPHEFEPKDLKSSFIRYVKTGIVMNLSTAKMIHGWLGNLIRQLENPDKKE